LVVDPHRDLELEVLVLVQLPLVDMTISTQKVVFITNAIYLMLITPVLVNLVALH